MQIVLPPEVEALVQRQLTSGNYNSAIAKRCCVRPWRLPLGEAQIAFLYQNLIDKLH